MMKKMTMQFCFCFWIVFFVQTLNAGAVDLKQAFQMALENDPSLQKAASEYAAAKELAPQALSSLLPTIGASGEYIHTEQDIISSDNIEFDSGKTDFPTTTYSVSLNQPIFHWDSIVAHTQSKKQVAHAASLFKIAEQDMIVNLADLYFQVLSAQDSLNAATAEKKAVDVHYQLAQVEHESGGSAITDLYDAKARFSEAAAAQIEAQHLLDDAVNAFQEMTGVFEGSVSVLKEHIRFPDPEPNNAGEWTKRAIETNFSLQSKRQAVEVARYEVDRLKAGHYPTLDFSAKFNNSDTDGSLFGGGSEVETLEAAVSLNIPIYQGGFVSSKTREAKQYLLAAEQEYEKEYRAVSRLARSSFFGLRSAVERVKALNESVQSYELASQAKLEGYRSNLFPLMAYLDAIRDLEAARQEYARARYDYILNSLKLKQAAGTLGSDDIDMLTGWFEEPKARESLSLN